MTNLALVQRLEGLKLNELQRLALRSLEGALIAFFENSSRETLQEVARAKGDPAHALEVARRDIPPVPAARLEAEKAANARTAAFRADMIDKAGGMYSRQDVADLLDVSMAAVDKQRQRRQILAVPFGTTTWYPAAQFRDGAVVPKLKTILEALDGMGPWEQLNMLLLPLDGYGLEPRSMLAILGDGVDDDRLRQLEALARSWSD